MIVVFFRAHLHERKFKIKNRFYNRANSSGLNPNDSKSRRLANRSSKSGSNFCMDGYLVGNRSVHIAITALIPLVFFPLLGVASIEETSAPYANKNIYLFMGGFFLSIAIQKCNLHKRIALNVLGLTGTAGRSIIAGFMVSSCVLSMWIMNTSTTVMLLPIGLAIISVVKESMKDLTDTEKVNFQVALLLGIAYAANIGGIATLIGTAPNMALNGFPWKNNIVSQYHLLTG